MRFQKYEGLTISYFEYQKDENVVRGVDIPNLQPGNLDCFEFYLCFQGSLHSPQLLSLG